MTFDEIRATLTRYREIGVISAALVVEDTLIFAYPVDSEEQWLLLAGDPLDRLEFSEDNALQYQAITLDTLEGHGDIRILWPADNSEAISAVAEARALYVNSTTGEWVSDGSDETRVARRLTEELDRRIG